jgi:hypothetical protein
MHAIVIITSLDHKLLFLMCLEIGLIIGGYHPKIWWPSLCAYGSIPSKLGIRRVFATFQFINLRS